MMDVKHIEPLKKLIESITNDSVNFQYKLTELMSYLFDCYLEPLNHINPVAIIEEKKQNRVYSKDFPQKLKTIVLENTDSLFLKFCPFSSMIVELSDIVQSANFANRQNEVLRIKLQLQQMVNNVEKTQPLLEMRELLNALLGEGVNIDISPNHKNAFVHASNDKNFAFSLFGSAIQQYVSTKEFDNEPYKYLNWKMLRYASSAALTKADKNEILRMINNSRQDFLNIRDFIDQLISIENTKFTVHPINPPLQDVVLTTLRDVAYDFTDSKYVELALEYLNSIDSMVIDNQINRFAIFRIITALGEVAKNISQDLKATNPLLFEILKDLRDGVVHEIQTASISESIKRMLGENEDNRLWQFKSNDLIQIKTFFNQLQRGLAPTAVNLSAEFVENLTKDYKLTDQERTNLLSTLPAYDTREIADKRIEIENILRGVIVLPNTCDEFAELLNGLGLSKKKMKDLYAKLIQAKKAHAIQDLISSGGIDADIKQVLNSLQSKDFRLKSFVDSIEVLNRNELSTFLADHILSVQISNDTITEIINQIPLNEIDISSDKELLKAIIEQKNAQRPEDLELNKALDRCLIAGDTRELWLKAFRIINGQEESSYVKNKPAYSTELHINALANIQNILFAIQILLDITTELRTNPSDKERFNVFLQNKPLIFACEYLYNLYIDNLNKLLWQVEKYNLSGVLKHEDFQYELNTYKTERNDIFHLNYLYLRPQENLWVRHEYFYDSLIHRIEGTLFPEAITIGASVISSGPINTISLKDKLTTIQAIIANTALMELQQKLAINQHLSEEDPIKINLLNNIKDIEKFIPKIIVNYIIDIKYNDNFLEDNLPLTHKKVSFLEQAELFLESEQLETLKILLSDRTISNEIIEAANVQGVVTILKILFNIKAVSLSPESQDFIEPSIQEMVDKIESIIGKETLVQLTWFYKYSNYALSNANKLLNNSAREIFKTIGNLVDDLQKFLNLSELYESIALNSQIAIKLIQLEQIFGFMDSMKTHMIIHPRYPDFDPGYDFGGSMGYRNNSTDHSDSNIMFFLGNTTIFDSQNFADSQNI